MLAWTRTKLDRNRKGVLTQSLLFFALACLTFAQIADGSLEQTRALSVRDIGVPVCSVNWVRLHPGRAGQDTPCLYATMGQTGDNLFVLQINPQTGRYHQFVADVPGSNFPTATLLTRRGTLYIGAAYSGHLFCFDPVRGMLNDLGAIHPGKATFPCRLDEDQEGRVWIGSYGTADLTCYDAVEGMFIRYGRMDGVDMYNYPLVNKDGTVACLIRMTRPHVVVLDPETGEKRGVGPVVTKGEGHLDLTSGEDGWLYISSSEGHFRIEGMKAIPVQAVPRSKPAPTLPDGSTFAFADADEQLYRRLQVTSPEGSTRIHKLDYGASGSDVFCLHTGPDGCLYGSSYLPLHLFRYDPTRGDLVDLGRCSASTGEAYSMADYRGRVYISSYPGARVSVYDPGAPYNFGDQAGDNPRDLGRIDDISYRPRSTLAGPLGRVWLASLPDYGMWGGPLSYYDPETSEKKAYYRIVGDGSCYTLAHLEDQQLIVVGTNIAGGSGTQPKVDQAVLFLWDYRAEKKVWTGTLDRKVTAFNGLLVGPDGRLYGTAEDNLNTPVLFVFDPTSREFVAWTAIPRGAPLDLGLQNGPDGKIYGFTRSCIYRVDPGSLAVEVIVSDNEGFTVPGPIVGKDIYFATGHQLRAAQIFK
jgi:outer membrane protein assembly factor BamB